MVGAKDYAESSPTKHPHQSVAVMPLRHVGPGGVGYSQCIAQSYLLPPRIKTSPGIYVGRRRVVFQGGFKFNTGVLRRGSKILPEKALAEISRD